MAAGDLLLIIAFAAVLCGECWKTLQETVSSLIAICSIHRHVCREYTHIHTPTPTEPEYRNMQRVDREQARINIRERSHRWMFPLNRAASVPEHPDTSINSAHKPGFLAGMKRLDERKKGELGQPVWRILHLYICHPLEPPLLLFLLYFPL
ncbi:hypothetical protein KQX54_009216 [Cotesia glomerata]|uniref:Uncharacterized protein n=1 Tax=Cotesia glomerata TaxID=32391 RepID=A0AAV7ICQ4_COTGL|nr:hypothetical protein KQX54_009216 [Cotesia glomerata]